MSCVLQTSQSNLLNSALARHSIDAICGLAAAAWPGDQARMRENAQAASSLLIGLDTTTAAVAWLRVCAGASVTMKMRSSCLSSSAT